MSHMYNLYNPLAFHFLKVSIFSQSIYEKPFFGDVLRK